MITELPSFMALDQLSAYQVRQIDDWLAHCEAQCDAEYHASASRARVPGSSEHANRAAYYRHARGTIRHLRSLLRDVIPAQRRARGIDDGHTV